MKRDEPEGCMRHIKEVISILAHMSPLLSKVLFQISSSCTGYVVAHFLTVLIAGLDPSILQTSSCISCSFILTCPLGGLRKAKQSARLRKSMRPFDTSSPKGFTAQLVFFDVRRGSFSSKKHLPKYRMPNFEIVLIKGFEPSVFHTYFCISWHDIGLKPTGG